MKKLKAKHYFILFAICVAVVTTVVALTMGKDLAISVLLTGIVGLVGFIVGNVIGKKPDSDKKDER